MRLQQSKVWRTFHFDPAGELVPTEDVRRGVQNYLYGAESRLLGCGQHTGFVYDGFGNLTQRTQGSLTQYFAYDDENRLLRSWGEGPQGRYEACYYYDALGRRIRKTVHYLAENKEITTRFHWQGLRLIQETAEGTTRSYVYDPDEEWTPLARITQRGEQQTEWFHTDLNGAPLELTDRAGNIVWCGRYSAWGKLHPQPYTEEEEGELPRQPLRYAGQYADEETGLHYNTFRYYDPEVGRFTTQDPIGLAGGLNLYAYVPNPVVWVDPLGLASLFDIGTYKELTSGVNVGDGLQAHELIRHEYLRQSGLAESTRLADNPSIALDLDHHTRGPVKDSRGVGGVHYHEKQVRAEQGLGPNDFASTINEELDITTEAMRRAGVPEGKITKLRAKAAKFYNKLTKC